MCNGDGQRGKKLRPVGEVAIQCGTRGRGLKISTTYRFVRGRTSVRGDGQE